MSQNETLRIKSYRLRDLKNGLFQIHSTHYGAYEGTPGVIFNQAKRMGIHEEDLKVAVNELHNNHHDYAEFGMFGRFLFTAKDKSRG